MPVDELRRAWWRVSACVVGLLLSSRSFADEPHGARWEVTVLPLAGGNSDVGFGGGYILSTARLEHRYQPYLWRVESAGAATFKPAGVGDSGLQMPYLEDYVFLHLPYAVRGKLELRVRLSYTREETLKFPGLGNASKLAPDLDWSDPYYEYARTHPTARWAALYHINDALDLAWGASYTYNRLETPPGSLLAQKMRSGSADERALLDTAAVQHDAQFSFGAAWDDRDSEVNPRAGHYQVVRLDLALGATGAVPNRWGRAVLATHAYVPLLLERLTFAVRFATDLLLGAAPLYELPRFDDSFFGGGYGIRGVPGGRYWGKLKALSNWELRSELLPFDFWHKRHVLGITAFFDTGRLWTSFSSHPEHSDLDGALPGLKFGTGLGLRITAGDSFVVRADFAYSPDANPIGVYVTSGQTF